MYENDDRQNVDLINNSYIGIFHFQNRKSDRKHFQADLFEAAAGCEEDVDESEIYPLSYQ